MSETVAEREGVGGEGGEGAKAAGVSPGRWRELLDVRALGASGVVVLGALAYLRATGRLWWCACRTPTPFSWDTQSSHNSQHLLDAYSFSHVLHGVLFFWALAWLLPRVSLGWRLFLAVVIETAWEVVENSPFVIERYRAATASLGYEGDTIVNITGDLLSCVAGFLLARAIGPRWSLVAFVAIELVMLWAIRDNLTLNVVMLFWPIEAIKQWQMGG